MGGKERAVFNFKDKKAKRGFIWVVVGLLVLCMVVPMMSGIFGWY